METILIVGLSIGALVAYNIHSNKVRREMLIKKYGDPIIVERIMKRTFWQGQTSEQLLDSLGRPLDVDTRVMKTKTKEVWKYDRQGVNRYGLRITLEDQVVVGWDQK